MYMEDRIIRVRLKDEQFRKYKVFCAINDISMTDQVNKLVRRFIEEQNESIKVVKIEKIQSS